MNDLARALRVALDDAGIKHRDYSGRGMYGQACVAVSCGYNTSEAEVLEAVRDVPRALHICRDSLGLGTIVYWPSARLEADDDGTDTE